MAVFRESCVMRLFATLFLLFSIVGSSTAQRKIALSSPDGKIVFQFTSIRKELVYSIAYKGKSLIEKSAVSLSFNGRTFGSNVKILSPKFRDGVEDYELIVGKTKKVHDAYREAIIPLESETKDASVNLVVRAFNDGVGLRYEFVSVKDQDSLVLTDEKTTFRFNGDPVARTLQLPNYTSSHEGFYTTKPLSGLKENELMDMPTLFELSGVGYVAITEAALVDFAGAYLVKENGVIRDVLSPLPGQQEIKVKAALPHKSPWRVILIGDRIGALIESNLVTDLNEPLALKDITWIKPGKTTFPWWNGNVVPDTLNAPGNNFMTQKYYIDFCARNGLEYHSVVEYGLHQWYTDDGVGFQPGPHSDVTKPVPGLDMKEVCDYAKSKGVGVRVWVHWAALYPKLDSAFAIFEKWGLEGMMIDFMDRDDQQMVNMQQEMLQKAAAHHLHVQFHGAYKPTGLSRTFPNEFTREGTLNYETNKWNEEGLPPDHDIMIPFTRMLAGSTDYHMGGFRAAAPGKYIRQYTRPMMLGTRCHMLGLYVVFENYLGMVCDYPLAYEGQPGFDFIKEVPTTWDETKVLDAKVGEYIVVARRKGSDWFLGAITNHEARSLTISAKFLSAGRYEATLYTDAPDVAVNADHLTKKQFEVTASDELVLNLAAGGGMACKIIRK
jgi:alpha-glucosidase